MSFCHDITVAWPKMSSIICVNGLSLHLKNFASYSDKGPDEVSTTTVQVVVFLMACH